MNDPMTAADPVQLFRETWTTYQKIIASDYMFHRELTRAIASSLMTLPDTPLSVLDLGCGDASQITGILNAHHIAEYRGCDLSLTALELARHHELEEPGVAPGDLIQAEVHDGVADERDDAREPDHGLSSTTWRPGAA